MSCWQQLGLDAPCDKRAIKRAYMTRLKVTRPEDDIAAFQLLRQAYEEALTLAVEGEMPAPQAPAWEAPLAVADPEPPSSSQLTPVEIAARVEAIFADDSAWHTAASLAQQAEEQGGSRGFDIDAHVQKVWALLLAGQPDEAKIALYQDLNQVHLDAYSGLTSAWYEKLLNERHWPDASEELLFAAFGWDEQADRLPQALKERRLQSNNWKFITQVAEGKKHHPAFDKRFAQMLIAEQPDWTRWLWLRGLTKTNAKSLSWVQENLPGWQTQVAPEVLAWLRKPRAQETEVWFVAIVFMTLVIIGGAPELSHELAKLAPVPSVMGAQMMGTALFVYLCVRWLAWLRVQWVVRLYWPLQAKDKPLTSDLPWLRPKLARWQLQLYQDVLFLLLVFAALAYLQLLQQVLHPWAGLAVVMVESLAIWRLWSFLLYYAAAAPGAAFWRQIRAD